MVGRSIREIWRVEPFLWAYPIYQRRLETEQWIGSRKKTWSCGPLCKNLQHVRNETSLKKQCQVEVFENRNYEHSQKYSKHKITQHRTLSIWGLTIWGWCALKKRLRCPCETFSNQSTSSLSTSTLPWARENYPERACTKPSAFFNAAPKLLNMFLFCHGF